MVDLADKYKKLAIKRTRTNIDIWFLNKCLEAEVTPHFARVKTSKNVPLDIKKDIEIKIIKKNICQHYFRLDTINCKLKVTYDIWCTSIQGTETTSQRSLDFSYIFNDINEQVEGERITKFNKVKNKLEALKKDKLRNSCNTQNNHKFSDFKFFDRVKNLSDIIFTDEELSLLSLGLKFCIDKQASEKDLKIFSVEVDVALARLPNNLNNKKVIRNEICNILFKYHKKQKYQHSSKNHLYKQTLLNVQKKVKDKNLIISKADKGNCLVILKKSDYLAKVNNFLEDNNFKILNENPFKKFLRKLKSITDNCKHFLEEYSAPTNLLPHNPCMPRLYGLPKIHKEGIPIRPVVSFVNTPVSVLSSFIQKLIMELTEFKPQFTVNNSLDFAGRVEQFSLNPNSMFVSFDVSNLFTSIPSQETLPLVTNILKNAKVHDSNINNILILLNFCLSQDFFVFNNQCFKQPDSLIMGSCLSPFLADIFMDNLEKNFILTGEHPEINFWVRYVDDIFCIINGNETTASNLLNKLNNIHPKINFTLEIENNNKINFLDLTLTNNKTTLKTEFGIYRKPTTTDHVIHNMSNHPHQHKMAAFYSYVHRLLNIPLPPLEYTKEFNTLKQIAYNNGYNPNLIHELINKIVSKKVRLAAYPSVNPVNTIYISLPFINNHISQQTSKILSSHYENLIVAHKTNDTLAKYLVHSKDKIKKLQKSGIYKLHCNDCPATYIGRTCRPLEVRIKEHISKPDKSAFGHHLNFNKHNFSPNKNSQILQNVVKKNFIRLDFLEDVEIDEERHNNPYCLNTQVNLNRSYIPIHRQLNFKN